MTDDRTPKFQLLSAWRMMHEDIPEPEWLIDGWLPKGEMLRMMFGGAPKARKSTLALELAVSLATGAPFLGLYEMNGPTVPVLYIQEENSTASMKRDVKAILVNRQVARVMEPEVGVPPHLWATWSEDWLVDLDRLDLVVNNGFHLNDVDHLQWLENKIIKNGYRFLFLDSLYRIVPGYDLDKGWQASQTLDVLDQLRIRTGVSVVVIHHAAKSNKEGPAGDRIMHSTYLRAWYDMLVFPEKNDQGVITVYREARELPEPEPTALTSPYRGVWEETDLPKKKSSADSRLAKKGQTQDVIRFYLNSPNEELRFLLDEGNPTAIAKHLHEAHEWDVKFRTFKGYVEEVLETTH